MLCATSNKAWQKKERVSLGLCRTRGNGDGDFPIQLRAAFTYPRSLRVPNSAQSPFTVWIEPYTVWIFLNQALIKSHALFPYKKSTTGEEVA